MIALKKKPKGTKCRPSHSKPQPTYSKDSSESTTEKGNEGVRGRHQFGFRRGKRTTDEIEMLRIIS